VVRVVRKHWIFLVRPALPFLGSIIALFVVLWGTTALPKLGSLWFLLDILAVLLIFATGAWFAWKDLIVWWVETYIITDKRIINSRGLLQPTRQETPIDRVQQVGVDIVTPLEFLFDYGTVHVYLTGGDLIMRDVPFPRKVKDAVQGLSDGIKAKKPKEQTAPMPQDPELKGLLETLAKGKEPPKLADADAHYPPLDDYKRNGPRRTFGGVLRIPTKIRYVSGEHTVKYIQRSRYILYRNLILPVFLMLIVLPVALVPPSLGIIAGKFYAYWWLLMGLVFLGLVVLAFITYINYIDDVYILTSRRIIDIHRILIYTYESRFECEYKNIRDIKVKVPNVLERFLDIGDVYIETPGSMPDIVFKSVDHPFLIQDEVLAIKGHKEKEDKVKRENDEKKLMQQWFGAVLSKMETTVKTRGIPDLRRKDLLSAIAEAQELGFEVEVVDKAIPTTAMEPGYVVEQTPYPGTIVDMGNQNKKFPIEIMLSMKPRIGRE
jgi:membrane protein YdbS with pleckstrin-like domain